MVSPRRVYIDEERPLLGELGRTLMVTGALVGAGGLVVALAIGLSAHDRLRSFWFAYLVAFIFWLSLSLGSLVFIAIQHATRASWSIVVRRFAEFFANNFILLAVAAVPLLIWGVPLLYEWVNPVNPAPAYQVLLAHKAPYLNLPFFYLRIALYFAVWIWLSRYFLTRSLRQDADGNPETTLRLWTTGGPALVIYALTSTFAAFDFIMTLTPGWYSTMFGVYFFAGSMLGCMAMLGATSLFLQSRGHLVHTITDEHYHDIGKLTFAFVFFWGYIAFSQFMLIWYGNIPEETDWFRYRQQGSWLWLEVSLLFGHFFIPFAGLLSRWVKRNRIFLGFWCVWVLVWHWVDVVYLTLPVSSPAGVPSLILPLLATVGLGGLYIAFAAYSAAGRSIIPLRDPRLIESLEFDNIKV